MTTKYVNVLIVVPAVLLITAATIATTTAVNFESVFAQSPSISDPDERSASPYAPGQQVRNEPGSATQFAPGQISDPNEYAPGQIGDPSIVAPGQISKVPGGATQFAPGQIGDPNAYSPAQIRGFDPQPQPPG